MAEIVEEFDLHANLITECEQQPLNGKVFSSLPIEKIIIQIDRGLTMN